MTDEERKVHEADETVTEKLKNDEKRKNDDREVEFSFDFGKLNDSFNRLLGNFAGDEETKVTEIAIARSAATSARIKINFSAGEHFLSALPAGRDTLIEGTITHVGEVVIKEEGDERKSVKISQRQPKMSGFIDTIQQGFRAAASRKDLRWDLAVTQDIPLDLEVDGGAGPVKLDLTGLTLEKLEVDSGVGTMDVVLPVQESHYRVDLDSGVGQTKLVVPENASVEIDVDAGVGQTTIVVPENAAVRLKADSGIGSISVPKHFTKVKDKSEFLEKSGEWQTEGYELAQRRINIKFDGGIGQFVLKTADIV